jgi:hypothetical protein
MHPPFTSSSAGPAGSGACRGQTSAPQTRCCTCRTPSAAARSPPAWQGAAGSASACLARMVHASVHDWERTAPGPWRDSTTLSAAAGFQCLFAPVAGPRRRGPALAHPASVRAVVCDVCALDTAPWPLSLSPSLPSSLAPCSCPAAFSRSYSSSRWAKSLASTPTTAHARPRVRTSHQRAKARDTLHLCGPTPSVPGRPFGLATRTRSLPCAVAWLHAGHVPRAQG